MRKTLTAAALVLTSAAVPAVAQDVGVASCDTFLKSYSACAGKIPEAQRGPMMTAIDAVKKNWVDVAKTADGKSKLDGVCKETAGKMKEQLAPLNCAW